VITALPDDEISLCYSCWCMTKTIKGICGKCEADKQEGNLDYMRKSARMEILWELKSKFESQKDLNQTSALAIIKEMFKGAIDG
jgi:hypothetical protein